MAPHSVMYLLADFIFWLLDIVLSRTSMCKHWFEFLFSVLLITPKSTNAECINEGSLEEQNQWDNTYSHIYVIY